MPTAQPSCALHEVTQRARVSTWTQSCLTPPHGQTRPHTQLLGGGYPWACRIATWGGEALHPDKPGSGWGEDVRPLLAMAPSH